MRLIGSTLTTLAAAGMLAFAVPGSAFAANGFLEIDGVHHYAPRGCFEIPRLATVVNFTDEPVFIHNVPGCAGQVIRVVPPGLALQVPGTHSIAVG
ncbi:hypothetical protein [Streptomyces sp. NPDC093970]|uniref:hypothetical protein n=1 Tax=unclassified Streptomyces TaxID=2593676 RepID=UPI0034489053